MQSFIHKLEKDTYWDVKIDNFFANFFLIFILQKISFECEIYNLHTRQQSAIETEEKFIERWFIWNEAEWVRWATENSDDWKNRLIQQRQNCVSSEFDINILEHNYGNMRFLVQMPSIMSTSTNLHIYVWLSAITVFLKMSDN